MEKGMICFENISKTFPGVKALSDVSFSVAKGEGHALLGENGAGKSTLLNILHGIYQADTGCVYLDGSKVSFKTPNEAILAGITKVHQEINAVEDLSVGQNITLGYEIRKGVFIDRRETDRRVNAILEDLGCNFASSDMVYTLSAGEKQMLAIAKALYHNSKVISFDEPTAALTEKETVALFAIIKKLKAEGITILYVSHRLDEIFQVCERATILRDGTFVTTVNVPDVTKKDLITYMSGHEVSMTVKKEFKDFSSAEVALKVEGFSNGKQFKDVSFELHKGEILGFFGLVGAGRTELMRAIIGADPKTAGKVFFGSKEAGIRNTEDALNLGIGLLPEERKTQGFVSLMSNLDNASLSVLRAYSRHGFVQKRQLLENYNEKAVELRIHPPDPAFNTVNLSGGNQQKVILARWMSTKSSILIFDEPTKGIDVATKSEIYKLMIAVAAEGKAIIMVSSELPEIISVSDRIVVMYEGEITAVLQNDGNIKENTVLGYAMGERQ